ncbi:hypothetical protein ACTXT7_008719 [Hymenolepis weldensis]
MVPVSGCIESYKKSTAILNLKQTDSMTNLAIAIAGVVDLFSRLFFGWLTDRPFCNGRRGNFLACTWLVEAIAALAFGEIAGVGWELKSISMTQKDGNPMKFVLPPSQVYRAE